MTESAIDALAAARALLEAAKSVPMTPNVLVNRTEMLALLDQADAGVARPATEAVATPEDEREAIIARAHAQAEEILEQARADARERVGDAEVVRAADAEAEALRLESHTWVDAHLAEFETGLQRTLEQIETLRDRLAARSRPDDEA